MAWPDQAGGSRTGFGHSDTTGQIRNKGAVALRAFFDHDGVAMRHGLSPACLSILFIVPSGMSTEGCPEVLRIGCRSSFTPR